MELYVFSTKWFYEVFKNSENKYLKESSIWLFRTEAANYFPENANNIYDHLNSNFIYHCEYISAKDYYYPNNNTLRQHISYCNNRGHTNIAFTKEQAKDIFSLCKACNIEEPKLICTITSNELYSNVWHNILRGVNYVCSPDFLVPLFLISAGYAIYDKFIR